MICNESAFSNFDFLGLVDFIHTETFYSIKRLLPGDLKVLYSGPGSGVIPLDENPFLSNFEPKPHETKGGMILTNYLTFNCIEDPEDCIRLEWICEFCEQVRVRVLIAFVDKNADNKLYPDIMTVEKSFSYYLAFNKIAKKVAVELCDHYCSTPSFKPCDKVLRKGLV